MARRILKWIVGIAVGALALLLAALALAVWVLTPPRLTPIVNRVATDALNARVDAGRVELTLWRTFPRLTVDVDSLTVVSEAFCGLPDELRAAAPAGSDTLLTLRRLHGAVNVAALMAAKVELYDIELEGARLNAVALDSLHANYDIAAAAAEPDDGDAAPGFIPDIALNRFEIIDSLAVDYRSVADSLGVRLVVARDSVVVGHEGGYRLKLRTTATLATAAPLLAMPLGVDLGGSVEWTAQQPTAIRIRDFGLSVAAPDAEAIPTKWNAALDLNDPLTVSELSFSIGPFAPAAALALLPEDARKGLGQLVTDMRATVAGTLTAPYRPAVDSLPPVELRLRVPRCRAVYNRVLRIDRLEADLTATMPGDLAKTVVAVNALTLGGKAVQLSAKGVARNLLADPAFDGSLSLDGDLGKLHPRLAAAMLGDSATLAGRISLATDLRCAASDFTPATFHRLLLRGVLTLDDVAVSAPAAALAAYTRHTEARLGTSNSFVTASQVKIDSLLTLSVAADTLALAAGGMDVQLRNARLGAGCLNRPRAADSTVVTPFGGMLRAERVAYRDADSMRVRMADMAARVVVRRYEGNARLPHVNVAADAGRIFFRSGSNLAGLFKSHFDVDAYIRPRRQRRQPTAADSTMRAAMRASREAERAMHAGADSLDLSVDEKTSLLLRRLTLAGRLTAERGRLFTPYFPLRNRISDFDMEFTTDSLVLRNIGYQCGHSDFTVSGAVRNIRRALTRGSNIELDWTLRSDSLNVNEIVQALYAGADYSAKLAAGQATVADADSEAEMDRMAAAAAADSVSALLVPLNIDARLSVAANNIVYSDMALSDLRGELLVSDGAVNLHGLHAASDAGALTLNALYSAPDREEMRFGMSLDLDGIDIKRFIDMIPAVDSLMPLLKSFEGIIDANVAATADVDTAMNLVMPTLDAAIRLKGRELVLLDDETFRTIAKWLMFKNKKKNVIEQMEAELLVRNSTMQLFPFVFDFDRYRLAVMGSNDLDLNLKYHISVLKSPLPFKFGINISGNPDDMKIRLGGAKYKPGQAGETLTIVKDARVNLLKEIDAVFSRGSRSARLGGLRVDSAAAATATAAAEGDAAISAADSLVFIQQGLLPAPPAPPDSVAAQQPAKAPKKKK